MYGYIVPPNFVSQRRFYNNLRFIRITSNNPRRVRRINKLLNLGYTKLPQQVADECVRLRIEVVNTPSNISSNKIKFHRWLESNNLPHLNLYTREDVDNGQLPNAGPVLLRKNKLYKGKGITTSYFDLRTTELFYADEVQWDFVVPYYKKRREYRLHFFDGNPLILQQKKRRNNYTGINSIVRNYDNGWIYSVNNVTEFPERIWEQLREITRLLKDDKGIFVGALDFFIIKDSNNRKELIPCEINLCPGLLSGTVTGALRNAWRNYIRE